VHCAHPSFFAHCQAYRSFAAYYLSPKASVLPGGRGHRQITQIRPYKKIICGEKLVAVKVAVSSNKVL
jgi:hypothetical protein